MKTILTSIKITDTSGTVRSIPIQVNYSDEVVNEAGEVMKVTEYTKDPELQFIIQFQSGKVQYSSKEPVETLPTPELV